MSSEIIYLNVGGIKYSTTRNTLCKYPQSMLGVMFSQDMDEEPAQLDKDGYYFIDRNGEIFEYILQFLRSADISLPTDEKEYNLLKCEVNFYQIEPLTQMFPMTNSGEEIKTMEMVIISYRNIQRYKNEYKKHYCRKTNNNQFEIMNTTTTSFNRKEYNQPELVDNHWQLIEQKVVATNDQMSSFILLLNFNKTSFYNIFKDLQSTGVTVTGKISYYVRK